MSIRSLSVVLALLVVSSARADEKLELKKGDHICIIGNTLADRMQHDGWLETLLQHRFPKHELVIRNLGYAADEVANRPREQNFGSPDVHLTHSKADVIFAFFGYNESHAGMAGLDNFRKQLETFLDHTAKQKYNGTSPPRVVLFSPIAHEDIRSPHLPDGKESNARLELYARAIEDVASQRKIPYVDIFHPTFGLYAKSKTPLTINGIHPTDKGNRQLALVIEEKLFGPAPERDEAHLERLRRAILDKNFVWFNRYRVTDGYNVFGGRSTAGKYDGQNNATIGQRELEIMDVMTANRDRRVWAVARGGDITVDDGNTPPPLTIKTNKPGKNPDGSHVFQKAEAAIKSMTVHSGMSVNLFASEERFPQLINPVQMSVDPDGNLWAAIWPSYPHWHPKEELKDALVTLYDDDRDGKADRLVVFADKLHNPTGFEFWGGGVIVASAPDLLFLKDTDGDGVADLRVRILSGIDSADTHHTANSFVFGTDGSLYYQSGIFQVFGIESPWSAPFRHSGTGVYRFDPLTHKSSFNFPIGPNPHGDVVDRWGNQFVTDGTGGSGRQIVFPPRATPHELYKKQYRPVPGTGLIAGSHFPAKHRGNLLIANAIGFQGVAQYKFVDKGSAFFCEPVEPILVSNDPNFRPTAVRIGGDGALYVSDWQNPLIGHLQHNIRDPNRDHRHGRIYRVTVDGQPLRKPVPMVGKPFDEVVAQLASPDDDVRYRARLELTRSVSHPYQEGETGGTSEARAAAAAAKFAASLDPKKAEDGQPLLEALFVHSMLHVVNEDLLRRVLRSPDFNVRAGATRILREWHGQVKDVGALLAQLAADPHPRVRGESLIAAAMYAGPDAAEAIINAATLPTDPNLDFILKEAEKTIRVGPYLEAAKAAGKLSPAGEQYALRTLPIDALVKPGAGEASFRAALGRPNATVAQIGLALKGLADLNKSNPIPALFDIAEQADAKNHPQVLDNLAAFVAQASANDLLAVQMRWRKLANAGKTSAGRQLGLVAWMISRGSADEVFSYAGGQAPRLLDVLAAAARVESPAVRESLYPHLTGLIADGGPAVVAASLPVLAAIPNRDADVVRHLTLLVKANRDSDLALDILSKIPENQFRKEDARSLVDHFVARLSQLPAKERTMGAGQQQTALARKLTKILPAPQAAEIEKRLQNLDVRIVAIGTVFERMIFDNDKFVVEAGRPVEFRFSNTDTMPHNLAILKPGTLEEIGLLSEATAQSPDAAKRQYIPDSPHVLLGSRLLQPGETQALPFDAPTAPGVYPIVCTYPGHWRRMYASLYVVDNLKAHLVNPAASFAKAEPRIRDPLLKISTQGHEWTIGELAGEVKQLKARSFDLGKSAFKVASCVACHKLNNEGNDVGPDLLKLDPKLGAAEILVEILDPSKSVNDKFQSTSFVLSSGRVVTGLVVGESPDAYLVVDNPLAKGKPLMIPKSDVEEQTKSKTSLMPKGLLDKLSREEVLDLIAYIAARGDRNHPVFQSSSHHEHHHGAKK